MGAGSPWTILESPPKYPTNLFIHIVTSMFYDNILKLKEYYFMSSLRWRPKQKVARMMIQLHGVHTIHWISLSYIIGYYPCNNFDKSNLNEIKQVSQQAQSDKTRQ